jgi:hypothetical protein
MKKLFLILGACGVAWYLYHHRVMANVLAVFLELTVIFFIIGSVIAFILKLPMLLDSFYRVQIRKWQLRNPNTFLVFSVKVVFWMINLLLIPVYLFTIMVCGCLSSFLGGGAGGGEYKPRKRYNYQNEIRDLEEKQVILRMRDRKF